MMCTSLYGLGSQNLYTMRNPTGMMFSKPGPRGRGAYETAAKGSLITDHVEYCRLRRESACDPFLGIPSEENYLLNEPFAITDEDTTWLENFTDISKFTDARGECHVDEAVEYVASEVNWDIWTRFLDEEPVAISEPLVDSGGCTPNSSCGSGDEYTPNFELSSHCVPPSRQSNVEVMLMPTTPVLLDLKEEYIQECFKDEKPLPFVPIYEEKPIPPPPAEPCSPRPIVMKTTNHTRYNPLSVRPESKQKKKRAAREEAAHRRRELNRDAALRYRERKRLERIAMQSEAAELEKRGAWLRSREQFLRKEVVRMRAHLRDLGAPA